MKYTVTDLETNVVHEFISLAHLIYYITYQTVENHIDFLSEINRSGKDMCRDHWSSFWTQSGAIWNKPIFRISCEAEPRPKQFVIRDEYNRIVSLDEHIETIKKEIELAYKDRKEISRLRKACGINKAKQNLPEFRAEPVPNTGAKRWRKYYTYVIRDRMHTKATAIALTDEDYGKFIRRKRKETAYAGSYYYDQYRTPDKNWKQFGKMRKQYMKSWRGRSKHDSSSLRSINIHEVNVDEQRELYEMAYLDDDVA